MTLHPEILIFSSNKWPRNDKFPCLKDVGITNSDPTILGDKSSRKQFNGWNLKITPIFPRKIIFPTSILGFHVNFPRSSNSYSLGLQIAGTQLGNSSALRLRDSVTPFTKCHGGRCVKIPQVFLGETWGSTTNYTLVFPNMAMEYPRFQ